MDRKAYAYLFLLAISVACSNAWANHVEPLDGIAGQDGWKCFCGPDQGPFGGPGEVWTGSLGPTDRGTASGQCDTLCGGSGTITPQQSNYNRFVSVANATIDILNLLGWVGTPARIQAFSWTGWFNSDGPGGVGDFEGLVACPTPADIECRTSDVDNLDWRSAGQAYSCSTTTGGICVNAQQVAGTSCRNYKVRFYCPVAVP